MVCQVISLSIVIPLQSFMLLDIIMPLIDEKKNDLALVICQR